MKRDHPQGILKFCIAVLIAITFGFSSSVAQPTAIDITLKDDGNGNLEVYIRPNAALSAPATFSALTFTISWEVSASATLGSPDQFQYGGPPFCAFSTALVSQETGPYVDGSSNYMVHNAFGGSFPSSGCDWVANAEIPWVKIPYTVCSGSPSFQIASDAWTVANNREFYASLNGSLVTGVIYGLGVPNVAPNATIDCLGICGGTTVIGTSCDDGDDCTTGEVFDASCLCTGGVSKYYSQGSGNISDAIWDCMPVGVGGSVTFDQNTTMVVQNGHSVNHDLGSVSVSTFELELGGTFSSDSPNDVLGISDSSLINSTNFGPLVVEWYKPGTPNYASGAGLVLTDAICNGSGVDFNNASLTINREFNITSGNFDANNNPIRLVSDMNGTALIGDLSSGTLSNAGNTTLERYIPGGVTNWRNLGTAMMDNTLEQWDNDFITSGIPNSDFPTFTDSNGDIWPNIYQYDETSAAGAIGGAARDTGFYPPANMANNFINGSGYWVWCGDSLSGTDPFTIDVTGTPNVGPIILPLANSLPNGPDPDQLSNMGWNMVSNPLPSPVDFSLFDLAGNIENKYWIYDPVSGVTALWDEGLGTSVPALVLNGNIQSSQAMWMHAFNSGGVVVVVDEDAKIDDASANGVFGGSSPRAYPALRVEISSEMNTYFDEVLVLFSSNGSTGRDLDDAIKLFYGYNGAPMLSIRSSENIDLTLNNMGSITVGMEIPMKVSTSTYGEYTLRIHDLIDPSALDVFILEDLQTGVITPITEGATYTFVTSASDMELRFLIHAPYPTVSVDMKMFLEGPYDGSSGLMNDDLRVGGFIPDTEPFTALGFTQVNGGDETIDDGVLLTTGNDAIVDWVLLELREDLNSSNIVSTFAVLVQRDGDVVSMDGSSPVELIAEEGEYYISVRHRNHLGVMTAGTFFLNGTPTTIDFSDVSVSTYGIEAQKILPGNVRVMWAGNVEPDDLIKYTGTANDRDLILTAIGGIVPTNTASGYFQEDVDMDGVVKYTGANNDRDPVLLNIGGSIPTDIRVEQLP